VAGPAQRSSVPLSGDEQGSDGARTSDCRCSRHREHAKPAQVDACVPSTGHYLGEDVAAARAREDDAGRRKTWTAPTGALAPQWSQVPVAASSRAEDSCSRPATALPSSMSASISASRRSEAFGLDRVRLVPEPTSALATASTNGVGPQT
jgi:hypothetical protein